MAKLLFPLAYTIEYENTGCYTVAMEGAEYSASETIKLFKEEGLNLLQKKYGYEDALFISHLKKWTHFIGFMEEQEQNLGEPCRTTISMW